MNYTSPFPLMKKYNISYWRAWLSQGLCDWVPHMLSDTYREERKAVATFLLHQYSARGKGFMLQIVTGWNLVPHFRTVTGLAHMTSPRKTQFKSVLLIRQNHGCSLLGWERFFTWTSSLGDSSELWQLYWITWESECMPSLSLSNKKNVRSVSFPWQCLVAQNCGHCWDHHESFICRVGHPPLTLNLLASTIVAF